MNTLVIRIAFLALPGLLGSRFYRLLKPRSPKKNWEDFTEILLFSLASYLVLGLVSKAGQPSPLDDLAFSDSDNPLPWPQISWASVIGLGLALLAGYAHTYQLILWVARTIRATNRTGDEDVWNEFHRALARRWIYVRDHKRGLIYYGWVQAYSESGEERELLLKDVDVSKEQTEGDTSLEFLYKTEVLYLSRSKFELTIEMPPENQGTDPTGIGNMETQNG